MSLYKRNGIYHYNFTLDGQRFRGSTNKKNEYEATLVLNDKMTQGRTKGTESLTCKPPLLKEFATDFKKWIDETHSIENKTRKYYKDGWRLLESTKLAGIRMDLITNHDCETATFPGSNYNANMALRTLRRMFAKAKEMRRIFGDLPKIELRKEWGRSIAMTTQDAESIAAKMKEGDPRDAFLILRGTGMRPGECFSMRWEYVRLDSLIFQNPKGKTKTARRPVPLLGQSAAIISRRHLAAGMPKEGWVFPQAKAKCGHLTSINKAFSKARDAAGLPAEMVLYTARHGQMTDLGSVCSLKEVMDIGGHSDSKTAMRYQHPDVEDLKARLTAAKPVGGVM